jgi:sugar lactone lactonase YvrE
VDASNTLSCCESSLHQVVKKSLTNQTNTLTIAAGTRCTGSASNQLNSTFGIFVTTSFDLTWPTGVMLDADGYLFIVDHGNHRVSGSGPNGYQCVVGCSGRHGAASNQLNNPIHLSFDGDGNLFVTDRDNRRIQKFLVSNHSCGK